MADSPYLGGHHAAARQAVTDAVAGPRAAGSLSRFFAAINIWFWAIVGLPTLIAGVYYFGIASDLYMSEVKFVVHSPGAKASAPALGGLLGGGFAGPNQDTYMVHDFIMSRDAVRDLNHGNDLRVIFDRPGADIVSRFPGLLYWRTDFEALYRAYKRFVSVEIDSTTGVATLKVKAYRAKDAQNIAQALLTDSERLVNRLNDRARDDALRTFRREVAETERHITQIQGRLTAYRVQQQMLDPKSASSGPLGLLAKLNAQRADSEGLLAELTKLSKNSPQIPMLRTRIASLDRLIATERAKITGQSGSVAAAASEYDRLALARTLAERQLASALASLEAARLQVQRQQIFIETIAQPNLPDYPLYPRRIVSFAMVLATCLLTYGIAWLLVAGVREHVAA